jgi:STE24 endopeptidase
MTPPAVFAVVCALAVVFAFALKGLLAARQMRALRLGADISPPPPLDQLATPAMRLRAADYNGAKLRLGMSRAAVGAIFALLLTVGGGLAAMYRFLPGESAFFNGGIVREVALLAAVAVLSMLISLPFEWRAVFRVEKKFGFSRMTPRLFIADQIKGALLAAVLGLPFIAAFVWLMREGGAWWWVYAWALWAGFNFLIAALAPTIIAPLFNKFSPLADEELKGRLENLLKRCGFRAGKGLFVMDGSKRSRHSNAYFAGFGAARRIVLFDTLLTLLSADEIEAVLAHELGHYKRRHIARRIIAALAVGGFALAGFALLAAQEWPYRAFGLESGEGAALALAALLAPSFFFVLRPLASGISRRHEYEADAFAAAEVGAAPLISALAKLYRDNAAALCPDSWYSAFYDSHPPAAARVARLRAGADNNKEDTEKTSSLRAA